MTYAQSGVDIEAAKKCGCPTIGVSYGYGTKEELRAAGADTIAETVGELRGLRCAVNGDTSHSQDENPQLC